MKLRELRVGDRFPHDGGLVEVVRVTKGAAYVRSAKTKIVKLEDREFEAHESRVIAISRYSSVELEGGGDGET